MTNKDDDDDDTSDDSQDMPQNTLRNYITSLTMNDKEPIYIQFKNLVLLPFIQGMFYGYNDDDNTFSLGEASARSLVSRYLGFAFYSTKTAALAVFSHDTILLHDIMKMHRKNDESAGIACIIKPQ